MGEQVPCVCRGRRVVVVECGECDLLHEVPCPDCTGIYGVVGVTKRA